jgi:hypothetical protein
LYLLRLPYLRSEEMLIVKAAYQAGPTAALALAAVNR